ncbi:MAG: hypothetical protein PHP35_00615 [Candidatus Colwellbacteria bacterium]|nr:hypothetical protein [Candidatus Colwellbacteria bacterium]
MNTDKGQILNEAAIAMGVITIGIVAVFGFVTRAISQERYVADQAAAVSLSSEGVEIAKNILDANVIQTPPRPWNEGFNAGYYELDYSDRVLPSSISPNYEGSFPYGLSYLGFQDGRYAYGAGDLSRFVRTVRVENVSSSQIRITSRVDWRGRNQRLNSISIVSDMFNWR